MRNSQGSGKPGASEADPTDLLERVTELRATLLAWFDSARRELPWRVAPGERADPYRVWASEVMLQQTRVETARDYFHRWMQRFPTLDDLAAASQDEVLKAWEGLGYYSRARNFHRAAREVATRYAGEVPADPDAFRALPGVGRYTAGAVMSIAFGREEPVVDGNVRRVFARWWDEAEPRDSDLWARAERIAVGRRPGDLNQALMELGATVCVPRNPKCAGCPVGSYCRASANGTSRERPARRRPRPLPHEDTAVAVAIGPDGHVLLVRRPAEARLGGMWEFPSVLRLADESAVEAAVRCLRDRFQLATDGAIPLGDVDHAFTHVRVTYRAVRCRLVDPAMSPMPSADCHWVSPPELAKYALPKAQRRIAALLIAAVSTTNDPG